ncbi:hypothetical protein [Stackebrandtia soli]|uniref:hypothetical protein n=1 Tax=Stackebrandtia soli TaxID=1892856 RepID=UPI0039E7B505
MTVVSRRPAALTVAAVLLGVECLIFAGLIAAFVYRTVTPVPGYEAYYGSTRELRDAALAEAIVIGCLLVVAGLLIAVSLPALLRGAGWARISLIAVAAGLVAYPTFLVARAIVDPVYVDWVKVTLTFVGIAGAVGAIVLLTLPSTSAFVRSVSSR